MVTGAASGVGLVAAHRFAEAGFSVVLADLEGEALAEARTKVAEVAHGGASVVAHPTDVTLDQDVQALADAAFALGPVAVLMNNAGIALPTKTTEGSANWRRLMDVNLFGVLQDSIVGVGRAFEVLDTEPDIADAPDAVDVVEPVVIEVEVVELVVIEVVELVVQ